MSHHTASQSNHNDGGTIIHQVGCVRMLIHASVITTCFIYKAAMHGLVNLSGERLVLHFKVTPSIIQGLVNTQSWDMAFSRTRVTTKPPNTVHTKCVGLKWSREHLPPREKLCRLGYTNTRESIYISKYNKTTTNTELGKWSRQRGDVCYFLQGGPNLKSRHYARLTGVGVHCRNHKT